MTDTTQEPADDQQPSTDQLEEPSTEKEPDEEPKAPPRSDPEPDHQAVGIGVIGGPQTDTDDGRTRRQDEEDQGDDAPDQEQQR